MKMAREVLTDKNPRGKIATVESLLIKLDVGEIHYDSIIFERMTGEAIKIAAYKMQGAASPLGIDAYAWRCFCSYKSALVDLCNILAEIARVRHVCMSTIHPQSLSAFVACRLIIPLKKNPGVRPTGIGKVLWHRKGKSILKIVGDVHDTKQVMKQVTKQPFVP